MLQRSAKSPCFVEHIGDAARHAGREVAAGLADHHDDAAGHVFAAMVADAFDDGDGAGVAHRETLAGDAAEIALALGRAVEHGVADDDRLFRHDAAVGGRAHDDAAAAEALADIVVAGADEIERDAARQERAERLAGGAGQLHGDGVVLQSGMAEPLGDLARQHRAGGAVDVADRQLDRHRLARVRAPAARSSISLRSSTSSIGCFCRSVWWVASFGASGL